nr:recombinase family protein [Falsihalocynthiibacter arcticus]
MRRIFEELGAGHSARAICGRLTDDAIEGPRHILANRNT